MADMVNEPQHKITKVKKANWTRRAGNKYYACRVCGKGFKITWGAKASSPGQLTVRICEDCLRDLDEARGI